MKYSVKWNLMHKMKNNTSATPLTIADMEFATAPEIKDAMISFINNYNLGYSEPKEKYSLSVVNWFRKRHNLNLNPDHLTQSHGVIAALYNLIYNLSAPNDGILIQPPVYGQFYNIIKNSNRKLIESPLVYQPDGSYKLDYKNLEQKLSQSKVMILCQPHNPIGKMYTEKELTEIHNLATKHNVTIISDEIHADLTIQKPFVSYASINPNAITCTSASKSFNLAALQTANIFIPNQYIRDKFRESNNKKGIHSPNILGYIATEAAYTKAEYWLDEKINIIKENYKLIKQKLNPTKLIISPLEATFLLWINYQNYQINENEFMNLLKNNDIFVSPGSSYGKKGEGYIRVNIATPTTIIQQFIDKLLDVIIELQ